MSKQNKQPQTLMEATRYFADPEICHEFIAGLRWPDGVVCPYCESAEIGHIQSRRMYQCKGCRKQFSIKKGTIFEDSALPLDKWLGAIWLIANAKNGISSYEVSRSLGVTQKSASFMLQRIRTAMYTGNFETKLSGNGEPVEVDETFIGGKARFMHKGQRIRKLKGGTGVAGKVVVLGVLERGGSVRTEVVENVRRKNLDPLVRKNVEIGSEIHTDALPSYESLQDEYIHKTVDHAQAYVLENVHTNGMENIWSLLKRGIKGTYVSVEPFHLFRYLDEQAFRFNLRKLTDSERFRAFLVVVSGKRLTYDKLIGECVS